MSIWIAAGSQPFGREPLKRRAGRFSREHVDRTSRNYENAVSGDLASYRSVLSETSPRQWRPLKTEGRFVFIGTAATEGSWKIVRAVEAGDILTAATARVKQTRMA